jgi:2-polyprenyl-6-methoxyphenol hydroxylase-like FAD-dependent oxidoreductase
MAPRRKAIVVGGGIGGVTAALALSRAGFDVTVHEQARELREVGAGLTVWPNAMTALKELGLSELVWALGRPFGVGRIYDWRGRVLVEGARREVLQGRFGWPGTVLHRHRLLDALAAFLPGEVLRVGRRCVGFSQDTDGVTVQFADGSTDRGDVLVGADGLNSVVRSVLLGPQKPRYCGYTAYRGITPFDLGGEIAYESWGVGQRFGFVPAVGGEIYWWAAVTVPEGLDPPAESYKNELLDRYKGWFAPIERVIAETPDGTILRNDIYDRPAARGWSSGRVTLLGDAAHPVTPDLGQGACLAMEDAVVLARCLRENGDVPAALKRYEAQRLRRARFIRSHSRMMGTLGQLDRRWLCGLRNGLVRWTPSWAALLWLSWQFQFEPPHAGR